MKSEKISVPHRKVAPKPKKAGVHARPKKTPLHGARIEDYALIGDCETGALVSRDGSIDWLCWPTFASAACFAGLLGTADHGFWRIAPTGKVKRTARRYVDETLVVETTFETSTGTVCLTDFMPVRERHSRVVRIVRGVRGSVRMRMALAIRFDYGRTVPWVTSNAEWRAVAGSDMVVLETRAPLRGKGSTTVSEFTVRKGQTTEFTLTYCSSLEKVPKKIAPRKALAKTTEFWTKWLEKSKYRGDYADAVSRSLMTLKALTYRPTGGIVAAVTASLPEDLGGERNWDYRYCWLRDTAFTLLVLLRAGYRDEAVEWRRWLLRAVAGAPDQVQTIYGISGEREITEWTADWLPGYENSRPVRIGNAASGQFQLDVFGEVASALARMPEAEDDIRMSVSDLVGALVNHLCDVWQFPDSGIWEVRGGPRHFVHSKVMAWVAVDRGIQVAEEMERRNPRDRSKRERERGKKRRKDLKRWKAVRETIHKEVCDRGFSKTLNSFVQSYGSETLDASCLRIALVGFLPATDPRIVGTVDAIQKNLMKDGFVQRYKTQQTDDGLKGNEGQFLACSFWLVADLWLIGRKQEARELFERLVALSNDLGLLSEEYDSTAKRMVGNFPQALSHIALIHAAFTMTGTWVPQGSSKERTNQAEPRKKKG